ncbi:amidohydrolase [Desulfovibrio sp. OttesenSCG-928-G15]|nr:amidohydrolase [Desulfovibrio sp. OttesenSCG-928-G15]
MRKNASGTFHCPDRLFVNGDLYTLDPAAPRAGVLAVSQGKIRYAGFSIKEGAARLAANAEHIDLGGKAVFPGFIDSHLHFLTLGQQLTEMDIYLKSREDILQAVAREVAATEPGKWIIGRGWNNEIWPDKTWPHKDELDAIAPNNPVILTRTDAHSIWVNSAALALTGYTPESPDPPGGEIRRSANGELTGILVDTAIFQIWAVLPPLTESEKLKAWQKAQQELLAHGITSIGDAWLYPEDFALLQQFYAEGRLGIRCSAMLGGADKAGNSIFSPETRPVRGLYDARLSLDMFKVVLDGSLGSRSAWLLEDYADCPGHKGSGRYEDDELLHILLPPARQGFRLCLHAIGDAAVEQALRAYAELARLCPQQTTRHRIEHFQIASKDQIRRCLDLGVIPAMQSIHEAADKRMAEARLQKTTLAKAYPWRGVIDAGGIIANGSDSPMENMNPAPGLHAAVARTPFAGFSDKAETLRLSRQEALLSYTHWAAMAQGEEAIKGRLAEGMLADFFVTDRDIAACPEQELAQAKTLLTVLGGEIVFES